MTESIAAVIVTFNRKALLIECLEANLAQTRPLDRIILVDNASTDGTHELLADRGLLDNDRIDYLRLDENLGGAGGFAHGMARAMEGGFAWMLLMDDDAVPDVDALEKLLDGCAGLPAEMLDKPCALTTSVVGKTGEIDVLHRRRVDLSTLGSTALEAEAYSLPVAEIDAGSFVGFMVSRATVDKVGLPRADFFIYYDDTEYSLRIRKAGGKIYLMPQSRIVHPEDQGDSKTALRSPSYLWRNFYQLRNQIQTYRLYTSNGPILFYRVLKTLINMLVSVLFFQPDKWRRSRTFSRAIWDGYSGKLGKTIDPAAG